MYVKHSPCLLNSYMFRFIFSRSQVVPFFFFFFFFLFFFFFFLYLRMIRFFFFFFFFLLDAVLYCLSMA